MGRVGRSRLRMGRWLPLFAFLLLAPAAGFCYLGWQSVLQEDSIRQNAMQDEADVTCLRRIRALVNELERIRAEQSDRHYYEWQDEYLSQDVVSDSLAFQTTQLAAPPKSPIMAGWFQWELDPEGSTYGDLECFPREGTVLTSACRTPNVRDAVLAILRGHLYAAPTKNELVGDAVRSMKYDQRIVLANEERGKIQEEWKLVRRSGRELREVTQQSAQNSSNIDFGSTPYLRDFMERIGHGKITVRYTPMRYSVMKPAAAPLDLLVWRLVWIPAEHTDVRVVQHDRYLIQGYAISLGEAVPPAWEADGNVEVSMRGWQRPTVPGGTIERSVVEELPQESVARRDPAVINGHPVLSLMARPNPHYLQHAWLKSRNRFLLLVGGLLGVVGVGFFLLTRGLRRERDMMQRKEDFVAAVTHELKTPLTGIRMYADMLKEGWVASPEMATDYANRILEESKRLGVLVDQVLDLAALERGVATLHAQPGDLGPVVLAAAEMMEARAVEAGAKLNTTIATPLPPVLMDPQLIRPLVLNLIDNAIKYGKGALEHRIDVSLQRERDVVVLRVSDRGQGMTAATQKTLFVPFHREGSELTRGAPGVGIGLALTKRYVDAHHAKIRVRSTRGEGTTIIVSFPVHEGRASRSASTPREESETRPRTA